MVEHGEYVYYQKFTEFLSYLTCLYLFLLTQHPTANQAGATLCDPTERTCNLGIPHSNEFSLLNGLTDSVLLRQSKHIAVFLFIRAGGFPLWCLILSLVMHVT